MCQLLLTFHCFYTWGHIYATHHPCQDTARIILGAPTRGEEIKSCITKHQPQIHISHAWPGTNPASVVSLQVHSDRQGLGCSSCPYSPDQPHDPPEG